MSEAKKQKMTITASGRNHGASFMRALHERAMLDPDAPSAIVFTSASKYLRMEPMKCTRNEVTEPDNFIFIPTSSDGTGWIGGVTGYWDGRRNAKNNAPIITFPEGDISLGNEFVTMYEPTEEEIDIAISERKEIGKGEYDRIAGGKL